MADEKTTPAAAPEETPAAPAKKPDSPADRVARAIKGLEPHALPEVKAGDVLALVAAVPDEKQSAATLALAKGAAESIRGLVPHRAAEQAIHAQAGDLAELLELVRGDAQ